MVTTALLLALTGCEEPVADVQAVPAWKPSPSAAKTTHAAPAPTSNAACVLLSPAMLQAIGSKKSPGKVMEPTAGVAVKSTMHPGYYMLAIKFRFRTPEDAANYRNSEMVGAWTSTSTTPGAQIYSMPGNPAKMWTEWPGAETIPMRDRDEATLTALGCMA
ncbi:hypothetical protein NtRootA9_28930 [Arthrobacter sp. NtRootA9]|nr:hypothetical protein NtRootA9_28930 [Arthrobacter sp. NtRootA9]